MIFIHNFMHNIPFVVINIYRSFVPTYVNGITLASLIHYYNKNYFHIIVIYTHMYVNVHTSAIL